MTQPTGAFHRANLCGAIAPNDENEAYPCNLEKEHDLLTHKWTGPETIDGTTLTVEWEGERTE